jgi:hypothetical protein
LLNGYTFFYNLLFGIPTFANEPEQLHYVKKLLNI